MGYIKIRTNSGMTLTANLNDKTDYDKMIKFLQTEREAIASKPKKSPKEEIVMNIGRGFDAARARI